MIKTTQITNCPQSHPDVVLRQEFEGQYLLFHLETGEMTGINHAGAFIWRQLDGQTAIDVVVAKMVAFFQVSAETARSDMAAFMKTLVAKNLLVTGDMGAL